MPGIPVARVVAVVADMESGKTEVGSGYLLDGTCVLTFPGGRRAGTVVSVMSPRCTG
jgi:hypothetical protein